MGAVVDPFCQRAEHCSEGDHMQECGICVSLACVRESEMSWVDLELLLLQLPESDRRAALSLLCTAIGDAVGLPFEFRPGPRQQIAKLCNNYCQPIGAEVQTQLDDMILGFIHGRTSGRSVGTSFCRTFSDDTVCTDLKMQAIAKMALPGHTCSQPEFFRHLMGEFLLWAYSARGSLFQGIGGFTKDLLRPDKNGRPVDFKVFQAGHIPSVEYLEYADNFMAGRIPGCPQSWGNGAVMSFTPQVVLAVGDGRPGVPKKLLAMSHLLADSHQHHVAQKAADLLGELLSMLHSGDIRNSDEFLCACVKTRAWRALQTIADQDPHGYLYPIKEFQQFAEFGDCDRATATVFLDTITGTQDLLKDECFGCFGELLRIVSNYGETKHIYVLDTSEPVRFSQRGLNSVLIALWCVANCKSMFDVVKRILYVGGDTDTIGAIAGQLAGPLLQTGDVCLCFKRYVGLESLQSPGVNHLSVANAAARRYFYRSVLFASYQWDKVLMHPPLSDPVYKGLTSADGMLLMNTARPQHADAA